MRIELFKKEKLGLKRDNQVRLVGHNPRWKRVFSHEAYTIIHKLNIDSLKLYHCGSTSVPGIVAKPIIDIVGSVSSFEQFDITQQKLKDLGYVYKGEYGIKGRRYFVLRDKSTDKKNENDFCHLHLFQEGSQEIYNHLNFRDSLRLDRHAALKYENFKKEINHFSRDDYSQAKGEVITEIFSELKPYFYPREKAKILAIISHAEGGVNTKEYVKKLYQGDDLQMIDLHNFKISPYKYKHSEHVLEQKDDFIAIIQQVIDADRVILATPVYWYAMSGSMKDFMDRFSDLLGGKYKEMGEKLYGKKVDLLSTGSDFEMPNGFSTPFNLTATYFGMDFMDVYYKRVI